MNYFIDVVDAIDKLMLLRSMSSIFVEDIMTNIVNSLGIKT